MSAGLVAVLIIAAVLLLVAGGLVWWVNRPVTSDRAYARQTLPLFGSDVIIDEMPIDDEEPDGDDAPLPGDENVVPANGVDRAAVASAVESVSLGNAGETERRAHRFAPPAGASPVSSTLAPRATGWREPVAARVVADRDDASANRSLTDTRSNGALASRPVSAPPSSRSTRNGHAPSPANALPGEQFEGKSLTFSVPTDGTLQFLPGRLEITAGKDLGREVRFVRVPGINTPRVTFGRVDGPMYRHVQLHDQTVSRKHATMELLGETWTLTNLSTTNPVVHNERLLGEGESQALSDGDRIEMGEVVFRYRVR